MTQAGPHPLEWVLFIVCIFSTGIWALVFYLKYLDYCRNKENGVIKFMLENNLEFGRVMLSIVGLGLVMSIVCLFWAPDRDDYEHLPQSYALLVSHVLIMSGLGFVGIKRLRRRRRMAYLLGKYAGLPGGRRETDPQAG